MVKMNLEEALASLRNSLKHIKSLLAWEQLKHSEAKSDQSPEFKMYDPIETDLRNECSFFLSKSTEIHRILNNGKTNVTFHILSQLIEKKIPFIFMDWKRTVRHLIPNFKERLNIYTPGRDLVKFPFNPFVVPHGIESNVYINQLVDVMSNAFTLGDGSRSILRKAIAEIYKNGNLCPTVGDIIREHLKKSLIPAVWAAGR